MQTYSGYKTNEELLKIINKLVKEINRLESLIKTLGENKQSELV